MGHILFGLCNTTILADWLICRNLNFYPFFLSAHVDLCFRDDNDHYCVVDKIAGRQHTLTTTLQ